MYKKTGGEKNPPEQPSWCGTLGRVISFLPGMGLLFRNNGPTSPAMDIQLSALEGGDYEFKYGNLSSAHGAWRPFSPSV